MNPAAVFQALTCISLWGVTYPLSKFILLMGVSPLMLVAIRFAIGGLAFVALVQMPRRREFVQLFALSVTLFTVPLCLTTYALKHVDASIGEIGRAHV